MKPLNDLLDLFDIVPNDISLFEDAFTHPSTNGNSKNKHHDYERLEFLGDSVLGLVVAEMAYKMHPDLPQGPLTRLRSSLVSTKSLADLSREFTFPQYIRVGASFNGDISKYDHILEDVFEAFLGATYLDQGFDKVHDIITRIFYTEVKKYHVGDAIDYKSRLQEATQAEHRDSVKYEIIKETGPAHDKHFVVHVLFDGMELGIGEGSTKKAAEQMAAKQALEKGIIK